MEILLLGASGFLGVAIQEELKRHAHRVVGYSSSRLDLTDPKSVGILQQAVSPSTVIVMAAAVTRDRSDSLEAFEANVVMATHLAQLLENTRIGKCIYVSSSAVYGDDRTNRSIDEESPPRPNTLYAMAKLAGEFVIRHAAERSETPLVTLRPCRVYGPGDPHQSYGPALFIQSAKARRTIELYGRGEEERDFLFVHDFARLVRLFISGPWSGIFNLSSGQKRSFAEAAALIARFMPQQVQVIHRERQRAITHLGFSLDKLRKTFPDFQYTALDEGLQRTLESPHTSQPMGRDMEGCDRIMLS